LRRLGSGLGAFNRYGVKCLANHFLVRHIGAFD
jgi:hypothetical protein